MKIKSTMPAPSLDYTGHGVFIIHKVDECFSPFWAMGMQPCAAVCKHLAFADALVPLQRWV